MGTTVKTHREARSLFIQSYSFGDVLHTMMLLQGQEFSERAAVMLPDYLYSYNEKALPVATHRYTSVADMLQLVESWNPDLVFFVSAYGLLTPDLRPIPALKEAVGQLRERGCRLVTTDPILGMSRKLHTSHVDLPLGRLSWRSRRGELRNLRRTFRSLSEIERTFRDVTHLYPVPNAGLSSDDGVRRVSFFNQNIVSSDGRLTSHHVRASARAPSRTREPSWLFIISGSDLKCQVILRGADRFASVVQLWLEHARREGKRPVLIAPQPFVDRVSNRLSRDAEAQLVPLCSYPDFVTLLVDAEYAFYWNTFSCSTMLRLVNALPVFFFDQGHIGRILKPCYEVGVRCYFDGIRPKLLDARERVDARALAELVAEQQSEVRAMRQYWQSAPSPGEVLDRLLREPND